MKFENAAKPPVFIDVFAGCGGLSLGLMSAGWRGLLAIEKDAFAFDTLKANLIEGSRFRFEWPNWLPKAPLSISELLEGYPEQLSALAGTVDMLVGGPPCQGFSSAGRRNPDDPRNSLVKAYLSLVHRIRPKLVLIENVRGITQDFEKSGGNRKLNYAKWITSALSEDYVVSTKMLNTSAFGVPQRRQRFFVVAVRKDLQNAPSVAPFDLIEGDRERFLRSKNITSVPVSAKAAISDLEVARNGTLPSEDTRGFDEIAYVKPRTAFQRLMHSDHIGRVPDTRLARHSLEVSARFQQIIDYCHSHGRLSVSLSPELKESFGLKKCAIRVLDPDGPSPTITSMPDDLVHYSEPRTLTVRETARLQGFPDWFAFRGKYTTGGHLRKKEVPRFTQVANAVPPLVAEAIGQVLLALLSGAGHAGREAHRALQIAHGDREARS